MADNEFVGSAAVMTWVYATGTVTLNTEYRTWSYTPSIDLIDATAGADTARRYINSFKSGQIQIGMLMQTSMASADLAGLGEGQLGTITYNPAGTASTRLKLTIPAISQGVTFDSPYADIVSLSVGFMQNGAMTIGTN